MRSLDIRKRSGVKDVVQQAREIKWIWTGHNIARIVDERQTKKVTDWYLIGCRRDRPRQPQDPEGMSLDMKLVLYGQERPKKKKHGAL